MDEMTGLEEFIHKCESEISGFGDHLQSSNCYLIACESEIPDNCDILTDDHDRIAAFLTKQEAEEFIKANEIDDMFPLPSVVSLVRKHASVYFANEDITILQEEQSEA